MVESAASRRGKLVGWVGLQVALPRPGWAEHALYLHTAAPEKTKKSALASHGVYRRGTNSYSLSRFVLRCWVFLSHWHGLRPSLMAEDQRRRGGVGFCCTSRTW